MIDVVRISRLFSKYHGADLRVGGLYAISHSKEQAPIPIPLIHPTTIPTSTHPMVPHGREPHAKGTLSRLSHVLSTWVSDVKSRQLSGHRMCSVSSPRVARSCQCRPHALYTAHGAEYALGSLATRCHPISCEGAPPIFHFGQPSSVPWNVPYVGGVWDLASRIQRPGEAAEVDMSGSGSTFKGISPPLGLALARDSRGESSLPLGTPLPLIGLWASLHSAIT